jgi:Ca-activated chloride channel family protein
MTTLQRATIILAAFGVISLLLTQANSHPSYASATAATPHIPATQSIQATETLFTPAIVTNIYQTGSGSFYFAHNSQDTNTAEYITAHLQSTSADITVTGPIARTALTQVFENTSDAVQSGIYVFPLPQDAGVDHLMMQVGERVIEGQIKRTEVAEKMFKQAKYQGKKASLVSQLRPNMFTTQIANIPPHTSIAVTIEYQQVIVQNKHNYALRVPLSITPRYQADNATDPLQANISHQNAISSGKTLSTLAAKTSIKVRLNTGLPVSQISSEHHPIKTINPYSTLYEIELDTPTPANKDFVLNWQLRPGHNIQAAHFRYQTEQYEYGLISLLPPTNDKLVAKRNVVFILDVSGSMVGTALVQAKQALAFAIQDLHEGDTFNIVAFSSDASQLWPSSQRAVATVKDKALSYLYELEANGGTEIKKALDLAFALPTFDEEETPYLNQIVFITDGSVSNENDLMQTIYQDLGEYRLFTVGIGAAPNAFFMSEAAAAGKGTFTFIGDISTVKSKMHDLLEKLKRPALTNIKLITEDPQHAFEFEVYPSIIPDLYADHPLMISYRRELSGTHLPVPFSIEGQFLTHTENGDLRQEQWLSSIPAAATERKQGIHKYWARQKIRDLSQQLYMKGRFSGDYQSVKENVKEAITHVALKHNMISQYTSLIAVDQSMDPLPLKGDYEQNKLAQYAQAKIPQTATPSVLYTLLGSFLVLISCGLYFFSSTRS